MAKERLSMRKIKEVLRLFFEHKQPVRQIAPSCNIARSTVADYLYRAEQAGLTWPLPPEMELARRIEDVKSNLMKRDKKIPYHRCLSPFTLCFDSAVWIDEKKGVKFPQLLSLTPIYHQQVFWGRYVSWTPDTPLSRFVAPGPRLFTTYHLPAFENGSFHGLRDDGDQIEPIDKV